MTNIRTYSNIQLTSLVALRLLIGWHLLFEGFSKFLDPNWSSISFLSESQWIMEGFANWIISHSNVLSTVDFLNTWGLIAIGFGLILGLFTQIATVSGILLLFMYYINNAPIIGIEYSIPSEGNYLIVNKTLIETIALFVIAVFPTGSIIGLDVFVARFKNRKNKK